MSQVNQVKSLTSYGVAEIYSIYQKIEFNENELEGIFQKGKELLEKYDPNSIISSVQNNLHKE